MDVPLPNTPSGRGCSDDNLAANGADAVPPDVKTAALIDNSSQLFPGIHVNARGLALTILATVALIFALRAAQRFFIPLIFGIFIAYTLSP